MSEQIAIIFANQEQADLLVKALGATPGGVFFWRSEGGYEDVLDAEGNPTGEQVWVDGPNQVSQVAEEIGSRVASIHPLSDADRDWVEFYYSDDDVEIIIGGLPTNWNAGAASLV